MSRPAKKGALDAEEISKLRTSFHAYGRMLVKAIGSATRTSAAMEGQCVRSYQFDVCLLTEQEKLHRGKGVAVDILSAGSSFGEKRHPST